MPEKFFDSGKFDSNGALFVSRLAPDSLKPAYCPYSTVLDSTKPPPCGTWCIMFSEKLKGGSGTKFEICQETYLSFKKFEDERTC